MSATQSELTVITQAKALCSYIRTVSDKSPKRFRFTLVAKLQNYALNVIENLYYSNEVPMQTADLSRLRERADHQRKALTELRLLGYMAQLAMEQQCILPKQYEQITKMVREQADLRLCGLQRGERAADGESIQPVVCSVLS